MTFATVDRNETNTIKLGRIKTFGAAIINHINEYRAERKELRKLYSHHTNNVAKLAEAQRDTNRVWY